MNHLESLFMDHEKDEINLDSPKFTKDGLHYYCDISMKHGGKALLRKYLLHDIGDIFDDLELENSYGDVIDKGVIEGVTNWQLYGSRKPEYQDYKFKYQYEVDIVNDDGIISIDETCDGNETKQHDSDNDDSDNDCNDDSDNNGYSGEDNDNISFNIRRIKNKKLNIMNLLPMISARNTNCEKVTLKKSIIKFLSWFSENEVCIIFLGTFFLDLKFFLDQNFF